MDAHTISTTHAKAYAQNEFSTGKKNKRDKVSVRIEAHSEQTMKRISVLCVSAYSTLKRFKAGNMVDIQFNFDNVTNDILALC